ncbi:MAG: DUF58 domain-containing protein [Lachnospiraceae bacterium]|nr:DUF58 domain-containing protein [Lachnospiraceae bacterium]
MKLVVAIFIAVFVYVFQKNLYIRLWNKGLDVNIDFHDSYLNPNDRSYITEVINNDKFLPLSVLHVKFAAPKSFTFENLDNAFITDSYYRNDAFSVLGNQKVTRKLYFTAKKRGYYTIDGISITAKDFFLTKNLAMQIPNKSDVYIFPNKIYDKKFDNVCSIMLGDMESRRSLIEDPYTFRGIRDYDTSFNMKRINWKATARTGDLKVNVYNTTSVQKVKILLNLDTNTMIKTEYMDEVSIELASSAAFYYLNKNLPVAVRTNGIDLITENDCDVNFGTSKSHMITIDKYLSRIGGHDDIDKFMDIIDEEISEGEKDVSYLIISSYHKEPLMEKLDMLNQKCEGLMMISPYYNIHGFQKLRSYVNGWEVNIYET